MDLRSILEKVAVGVVAAVLLGALVYLIILYTHPAMMIR